MAILFRATPTFLLLLLIFRMIHADRPRSKKNSTLGQDNGTIVISRRNLRHKALHLWSVMAAVAVRAQKEHLGPPQTLEFQNVNAKLLDTARDASDEQIATGIRGNSVPLPSAWESIENNNSTQTFTKAKTASTFNASSIDLPTLQLYAGRLGSEAQRDVFISGMYFELSLRNGEMSENMVLPEHKTKHGRVLARGGSGSRGSGSKGSSGGSSGTSRASRGRNRFSSKRSNALKGLSGRSATRFNLRNYWFYLIISEHAEWMSENKKEGANNFKEAFADGMGGGYYTMVLELMSKGDDETAHDILGKIIEIKNVFSNNAIEVPADVATYDGLSNNAIEVPADVATYDGLDEKFDTRFGDDAPDATGPPISETMMNMLIDLHDEIIILYDVAMGTFNGVVNAQVWRDSTKYLAGLTAAILAAGA